MSSAVRNKLLRYHLPTLAWALVIFLLSTLPPSADPGFLPPQADKLVHLIEYAILAFLAARSLHHAGLPVNGSLLAAAVLAAALYGVTDELHQLYVPGRQADLQDWIADLCGSAAGGWWYLAVQRRRAGSIR